MLHRIRAGLLAVWGLRYAVLFMLGGGYMAGVGIAASIQGAPLPTYMTYFCIAALLLREVNPLAEEAIRNLIADTITILED